MEPKSKVFNRSFVVVGAIMIQLALGAIYAWSVFTKPLVESGWTKTQTQLVFSAGLALFAIVMVIAGRLMPKFGPQKLAFSSGIVLGLGYIIAGLLGAENFVTTFIFVGIVGGAGIGIGYVVPIAVGMRWYPDKKGLITGLAVAGFGFGATIWMALADKLGNLGGGHFLESFGISTTFIIYGVAYLVLVVIGSLWMKFPPDGWKPKGWNPPVVNSAKPIAGQIDFTSAEMLRTPQFYLILLTFAFGASAGLMSIGLMKLWPMQALVESGVSQEAASSMATLAMGVFFALFNGLGRILWGMISDKIGRKLSIIIMTATQGVFVYLFQYMAGSELTLYLFAILIGFNFGGNFALFPTMTADTFGTKFVGQNYGWVFLAYAVGGIFGPIMGGKLGDMNNFPMAFAICGVLCLLGVLTIYFVKPPMKKA
ncbi:MAG TPA: MFS transporter [Saprospirales bacterium]|nr:MFS transporter [Saprospirales bacterium]HAY70966.1 MFS transporter [Saprospirales bacterium]HRQ28496.1 OFA family MFS transporter [Saprospiraceae bacterium]